MDRIEPQRIDVEFPEPVEGVADEEAADLVAIRAVKVDGLAPRRAVAVGEVRAEVPQTISFGPEMVVHHVEHYGQAGGMSGVDQVLQCPRPAVGILHRIWEDAVVTPIARARELGQRHQLDRRHAEFAKAGEARTMPPSVPSGEKTPTCNSYKTYSAKGGLIHDSSIHGKPGSTTSDGPATPSG